MGETVEQASGGTVAGTGGMLGESEGMTGVGVEGTGVGAEGTHSVSRDSSIHALEEPQSITN